MPLTTPERGLTGQEVDIGACSAEVLFGDDYHACFDCMIDPTTKRYLSEDYAFCRRWQQIGGKIYADLATTLGHVGNLPFSGCLKDRLKA